jgi:hypothetical protein
VFMGFRNVKQRVCILFFGLFFALVLFNQAFADEQIKPLNSKQQIEIIEALSNVLERHYVLPLNAKLIINALLEAKSEGEFSSDKTINAFIEQTNKLMQKVSPDKHLVLLTPKKYNQMMVMFHGSEEGKEPAQNDNHQVLTASHHGHNSSDEVIIGEQKKSTNPFSIVGVSNVSEISRDGLNQTGYLALERFDGSERAITFLDQVFSTFTESDNVIIDIRNCAGGDAEMVTALSSYFFDVSTHLLSTTMGRDNKGKDVMIERWTKPNRLSHYFADKPLKVLISKRSFSAAESFAFGMQATGRGEIMGERSAGGGYTNDFFPLAHDLGASISIGRTFDPRTGKGWQGMGVIPDVKIQQDHALSTALTAFTLQSGKLDEFTAEEQQIYQQMQGYTNAWYAAESGQMEKLLGDDFTGIHRDENGRKIGSISREQLLIQTKEGKGTRANKIHYNRIIHDIKITQQNASVTLILRETVHRILLTKLGKKWVINRDDFTDKVRS